MAVSSSEISSNEAPTRARGTLLLSRGEVKRLLSLEDCIDAVEAALKLHAEGNSLAPGMLAIPAEGGGFHIKAAGLAGERRYFAAKTNANFPQNPERFGLPTIQGIVFLADAERGTPLAVMDSIEITAKRTAAATAVATKFLARAEAAIATVCGCGVQGEIQLEAIAKVRPIRRAYAHDLDPARAAAFANEQSKRLGIAVEVARDLASAVRASDIVVTCTSARAPFLERRWVAPGCFIAAVGADAPYKQELEPALLATGTLVVDQLEQCAAIGELHHALDAGLVTRASVHAELAEIVTGAKPGRTRKDEITIFDSTGTALQDAAAAIVVYRKAIEANAGRWLDFAR